MSNQNSKLLTCLPFTHPLHTLFPSPSPSTSSSATHLTQRTSHRTPLVHYSPVTPLVLEYPFHCPFEQLEDFLSMHSSPVPCPDRSGWVENPQAAPGRLLAVSPHAAGMVPDLDFRSNAGRNVLARITSGALFPLRTTHAHRYGGHQFGHWAGQLGDGRAISLCLLSESRWELQLKGAGRTPYSRFADGLAVLRSSVREFLGTEAAAALGIPTSRSLSLCSVPGVKVSRERVESAALVLRMAPSWIRFGSFQIHNPPIPRPGAQMERAPLGALVRHVCALMRIESCPEMLGETARLTAKMIASWQAFGFMHGVMNTDNLSILGLTIDYGPYAFMDVFDENHICNHSDSEGRYSYANQPEIGAEAIQLLGDSLAEYIGWQSAAGASEFESASLEDMRSYRSAGQGVVADAVDLFSKTFELEYNSLMAKRLGLVKTTDPILVKDLLNLMQSTKADYNLTFRALCHYDGSNEASVVSRLSSYQKQNGDASTRWYAWLASYKEFLNKDGQDGNLDSAKRLTRMKKINPHFVLRQWVLEDVIQQVEKGDTHLLNKVLELSLDPFGDFESDAEATRLCDSGPEQLLGFQCSCSS